MANFSNLFEQLTGRWWRWYLTLFDWHSANNNVVKKLISTFVFVRRTHNIIVFGSSDDGTIHRPHRKRLSLCSSSLIIDHLISLSLTIRWSRFSSLCVLFPIDYSFLLFFLFETNIYTRNYILEVLARARTLRKIKKFLCNRKKASITSHRMKWEKSSFFGYFCTFFVVAPIQYYSAFFAIHQTSAAEKKNLNFISEPRPIEVWISSHGESEYGWGSYVTCPFCTLAPSRWLSVVVISSSN